MITPLTELEIATVAGSSGGEQDPFTSPGILPIGIDIWKWLFPPRPPRLPHTTLEPTNA